jgi:hypothetical protein
VRRRVAIAQDRADAGPDDAAVPDNEGAERLFPALGVLASQSHRLFQERALVAGLPAHVDEHCRIIGDLVPGDALRVGGRAGSVAKDIAHRMQGVDSRPERGDASEAPALAVTLQLRRGIESDRPTPSSGTLACTREAGASRGLAR